MSTFIPRKKTTVKHKGLYDLMVCGSERKKGEGKRILKGKAGYSAHLIVQSHLKEGGAHVQRPPSPLLSFTGPDAET